MTPHDELMALAGKWIAEAEAEGAFDLLDRGHSNGLHACAADLRALLDSDAFRAMVRDAERWAFVRDHWHNLCTATGVANGAGDYGVTQVFIGVGEHEPYAAGSLDAAIDAAASGAITPPPPTSEGEK